jgi:hypothetical protein
MLSRATILSAFTQLSDELGKRGVLGELNVVGGTARAGIGENRGDAKDIAFLIRYLGLTEASAVMKIVTRYYDPSQILPHSIYLVDEILEEIRS